MRRSSISILLCLAAKAATEQELMKFNINVTDQWFRSRNCSFYQSTVDTVFICNDSEIYIVPRDAPYNQTFLLKNVYFPDSLNLDLSGKIGRVMP